MTCYFHQLDQSALQNRKVNDNLGSRLCDAMAGLEQSILRALIQALMLACANGDAHGTCQTAIKKYPTNARLIDKRDYLQRCFDRRVRGLEGNRQLCLNLEEFNYNARSGIVVRRLYPWMNPSTYQRDEQVLSIINDDFFFCPANCTVFLSSVRSGNERAKAPRGDVLGIMATRDITKDETVLCDDVVISATI